MNKSCARITLDIKQASSPTFVAVKRGDIGRNIVISLSDGGFPYEIAADCYAVLTGTKPDGNILYNHCDIEGNTIVYEITEQTTAAAGRIKAEVKLYSAEDALVTSATFRIIVDGTVYSDDQVESSSEFSALTQLMKQVLEVIQNKSGDGGGGISITIVKELPTEGISTSTLYLVKDADTQSNIYTEYLYVNGNWEIIGSQRLDLTGYIKTINGEGPDENGDVKIVIPDSGGSAVLYTAQNLTEEQKAQARENIGVSDGGGPSTENIEKLNAIASISIEYGRYEGASYYLARIPRYTIDGRRIKPKVAITSADGSVDGTKVSALTFAKRENTIFTINAGLFNTQTMQPQGQTIIDGVSVTNTPMTDDMGTAISDDECYPLCISTDGDLSAPYERSVDTTDMLADHVIYAVTAWGQFIENYAKSDSSKYNEIVHPGKYVRQVIGQYQNGDYFVCTVDGIKGNITENEAGMTYDTLSTLLISKGVKFAYSLDGGGSASTVLGNRQINPIFDGGNGRKVPTVLYFTTDEYPEIEFPVNESILYKLPEATTFNGTNYIDTGVQLYDTAKDFSIVIDCSMDTSEQTNLQVFACCNMNADAGIKFSYFGAYQKYTLRPGKNINGAAVIEIPDGIRTKMVVTAKNGILSSVKYCQEGGSIVASTVYPITEFTTINRNLLLGCGYYYENIDKYWKGTVYDFKVYNYALSDEEITAYLS